MDAYIPILFFLIALLYSSVGFGGGSGYLALLGLLLTDIYLIRSTALVLNLCVVGISTFAFLKNRIFDWKSFWPFLVLSIPLAFFAAQWKLSEKSFFIILGLSLIGAGLGMMLKYFKKPVKHREINLATRLGMGGGIGFLSGLSGIGGGIYLSPLLNLVSWENSKKIASLASIFIFVNSLAGLTGFAMANTLVLDFKLLGKLLIAVSLGAVIGTYFTNRKFNTKIISLLTAALVLYVGGKLILMNIWEIQI